MATMRHVSIERRRGNANAVDVQYRKYIDEADSNEVRSFYSIKYARYLTKVTSVLFIICVFFCRWSTLIMQALVKFVDTQYLVGNYLLMALLVSNMLVLYEGRSINMLQKGIILLIFET